MPSKKSEVDKEKKPVIVEATIDKKSKITQVEEETTKITKTKKGKKEEPVIVEDKVEEETTKITKTKKGKKEEPVIVEDKVATKKSDSKKEPVIVEDIPKITKTKKGKEPVTVKDITVTKKTEPKKSKKEEPIKVEPKTTMKGKTETPKKIIKKEEDESNVSKKSDDESNIEDENILKEWKKEWAIIVQQISDLQKTQQTLETNRDDLVKKISNYLSSKKGIPGENILDSTTKMKKIITKVDPSNKINNDDDSDTSENDEPESESEEDSEDDATPAELLKKGKQPIKFNSKTKKNLDDDSDSD